MNVVEDAPADPVLGPVAADPFDRGALVGDPARGVRDELDVDRVLDERAEPLLAAAESRFWRARSLDAPEKARKSRTRSAAAIAPTMRSTSRRVWSIWASIGAASW
jgi:hypothetical protein